MLRFWKQFFSFALMFSVLFSGQSIGHAEEHREFAFTNSASYNRYRINITKGFDSSVVSIIHLEMMENANPANPTNPEPDPNPDPNPNPTGDNGLEKEFDLSASEVEDFIDWYNNRADGRGKETYMFDKDFNKGPWNIPNNTPKHILYNRKVPKVLKNADLCCKNKIDEYR